LVWFGAWSPLTPSAGGWRATPSAAGGPPNQTGQAPAAPPLRPKRSPGKAASRARAQKRAGLLLPHHQCPVVQPPHVGAVPDGPQRLRARRDGRERAPLRAAPRAAARRVPAFCLWRLPWRPQGLPAVEQRSLHAPSVLGPRRRGLQRPLGIAPPPKHRARGAPRIRPARGPRGQQPWRAGLAARRRPASRTQVMASLVMPAVHPG
jgi:hypothetical protein